MTYTAEQTVKSLLAELDQVPMSSVSVSQTRRSEILEEILRLIALSLEAQQRADDIAKHGRWV
jgi:hypothetical protein